jgi:5'(3')-deoxyribonucleotidase
VIAIDCDDVLMPTSQNIIDDYNERFGTKLTLHDMYQPARVETWGTDSDDVAIERVNEFLRSDKHAAIMPSERAIHAVKQLAGVHELHLVTGRADFLQDVTKRMLEQYFAGCFTTIEHTNFITSSTSSVIRRSKGDVCAAIGAHLLIDDHAGHGEGALRTVVERVVLFGEYPWNSPHILPAGMVRCLDWDSVITEIEAYANR